MVVRSAALSAMIGAARAAGHGLTRDFARRGELEVDEKGPSDYVSAADLASQATLRATLAKAFPDHAFVLEEGAQTVADAAHARFIVDPLDGTTNFLQGLPHFSISIALEEGDEIVAGVVFDPMRDELFSAEKGAGAWLGDAPLRVAKARELSRSVIGTGVPHRGRGDHPPYLEALARVMREVAGIRRFGSAALDLAYVAAGRFDAFFELGLAPWDVAAGMLLVREAGGQVTQSDGLPAAIRSQNVLASRGEPLHGRMIELLERLRSPRAEA